MRVTLCDVGPRDGLQNEPEVLAPAVRAELVGRLAAAGLPRVEAVSFVRPDLVPQMAGAEEVVAAVGKRGRTELSGLVLNERGFERLRATGLDRVNEGLLGRGLPGRVYRAGPFPPSRRGGEPGPAEN